MMLEEYIVNTIKSVSPEIADMISAEDDRQSKQIELIASENFMSRAVRAALASSPVNKYAEGYPTVRDTGRRGRYYGGCENIDRIENYCCDLWRQVFDTDYHVNVQPHSGTSANFAAYASVCERDDVILAPMLSAGGHLSHSSEHSFVADMYRVHGYGVDENGFICYEDILDLAREVRPKLIVSGMSAYSRQIDYIIFSEIAKDVGAYLMVDMAHVAGLVATGYHRTPFPYADIVTTTTQKTLRGPRGGMIFCKPELAEKVDRAVFPFSQGGPHENVITAKAVCAVEALLPEYCDYIRNVVMNAKAMAIRFADLGYDVVSGGTDNHMMLIDLRRKFPEMTGRAAENALEMYRITVNKNLVPGDTRKPMLTSGLRIGTPAMTTNGWGIAEFEDCAERIDFILEHCSRYV